MTQVRASTIGWLSAALPSYEDLREQIVTAALERTCLVLPLPTDRANFLERKEQARTKLNSDRAGNCAACDDHCRASRDNPTQAAYPGRISAFGRGH